MTKFRDLRGRSRARRLAADRTSRAGSPRPRSRNCLAYGNFLSSDMRRSRTAAVGITHVLTPLLTRTLKGLQSSFASIHTLPHAAKAANRGILRRETLLVPVIVIPLITACGGASPGGEASPFRPFGTPSWRRQGKAPPAGKKSPLKKAISKFGVRAQHTVLVRMMHASP